MRWRKVEKQCSEIFETKFISMQKPTERRYMISIIAEEFPEIPRVRIAVTVDRSIKHLQNPISRSSFLRFMQTNL